MIGASISRWTMTYFAMALAWLLIAMVLMVAGTGYPAADIAAPDTLVLVHTVCIGWLSLAMCGALFQFVPVLVAKPLYSESWALPALVLLTAGLVSLLAGFLALGGRLPSSLWLLPLGAVLLVTGFGLVVVDLGLTALLRPTGPARFVLVGLASLCATVAFGAVFAFALTGWAGSVGDAVLASGIPLHAIAGLGGWLTLTAMGVSYRLLSMFMLSPDVDDRQSRVTLAAGALAIAVTVVGGILAIGLASGLSVVLSIAAVFGLASAALYGRDIAAIFRSRKRRQLELNMRMATLSFASLAGTALLVGALSGGRDILQPLAGLRGAAGAIEHAPAFQRIDSSAQLDSAISAAAGKPVMLDFYADWCVSCKEMERYTFTNEAVRTRLAGMVALQADVTQNNDEHKALLKRFSLFGPPGIIFFDRQGKQLNDLRVVGFQPADKFAATLDLALQ